MEKYAEQLQINKEIDAEKLEALEQQLISNFNQEKENVHNVMEKDQIRIGRTNSMQSLNKWRIKNRKVGQRLNSFRVDDLFDKHRSDFTTVYSRKLRHIFAKSDDKARLVRLNSYFLNLKLK